MTPIWQPVSGCCVSPDGVLCPKLCHKSEGTCAQGTPRWWQCSYLRLQEIDRREENYKENPERVNEWKREMEISFSSLLSMMNQLRRGHLTPVTQPARHNYLQGEDGGLAGELCTAPSEIGERLKIISVTGPVFMAPSNQLNAGLWSPRRIFFVNCTGTAHKL